MPTVVNETDTIRAIINGECSIARFGDGELKLCTGKKQMSQKWSNKIQRRLRSILAANNDDLLVGIPRIYDGHYGSMPEEKRNFWLLYKRPRFMALYDEGKQYYSAFITRPDSAPAIDNDGYWDLMRQIWGGRNVTLLQGKGRGFHKDPHFLGNVAKLTIIYGPRRDSFEQMGDIMEQLMARPKDDLFILSLGPAATVLAHALCKRGRQALDLGHAGMFYAHIHPKSTWYTGEYYDTDK